MNYTDKLKELDLMDKKVCIPIDYDIVDSNSVWRESFIVDADGSNAPTENRTCGFVNIDVPLDMYRIKDAEHDGSVYYVCHRGYSPTVDNLTPFDNVGHSIWTASTKSRLTSNHGDGLRSIIDISLLRNGKPFDKITTYDPVNDINEMAKRMEDLHVRIDPVDFRSKTYKKDIIGKRFYYMDNLYKVTSYISGMNTVMADTVNIAGGVIKIHVQDKDITWV